jgi:hypothetical protein
LAREALCFIIRLAGQAPCLRVRLSSNVRQHVDYLLWPMQLFVWHPIAALAMAAAFAGPLLLHGYASRPKAVLAVVALVWLAYAGWEAYVTQWRSSTGDMAIRVEMLLLGPALLVAFVIGLAAAVFGYKRGA